MTHALKTDISTLNRRYVIIGWMLSAAALLAHDVASEAATCPTGGLSTRYIGATIFKTRDKTGIITPQDKSCETNSEGRFKAPKGAGKLFLAGGVEQGSGAPNPYVFYAPAGAKGIGVLSTIWDILLKKHKVKAPRIPMMFGLNPSYTLKSYRFVPSKKPKILALQRLDLQLETLLDFTLAASGSNPKTHLERFATSLTSITYPLNMADSSQINQIMVSPALAMTLTEPQRRQIAETGYVINTTIADQSNQWNTLSQLRAEAAIHIKSGNFVCLSKCFNSSAILGKLAGTPCSCDDTIPPPEQDNHVTITGLDEDTADLATDPEQLTDFKTKGPVRGISGTAGANIADVIIYQGINILGTARAINGAWSFPLPTDQYTEGQYTLTAFGRDVNGEVKTNQAQRILYVMTGSPATPTPLPGGTDETSLPGRLPPDGSQETWFILDIPPGGRAYVELRQLVNGVTEFGPTLGPYDIVLSQEGRYQMNVTDRLAPGNYNLKLYVTDIVGNRSCASSVAVTDPDTLCPHQIGSENRLLTVFANGTPLSINPPDLITSPSEVILSGTWSGSNAPELEISILPKDIGNEPPIELTTLGDKNTLQWNLSLPLETFESGKNFDVTAVYRYANRTDTVTSSTALQFSGPLYGVDPDKLLIEVCSSTSFDIDEACAGLFIRGSIFPQSGIFPESESIISLDVAIQDNGWYMNLPIEYFPNGFLEAGQFLIRTKQYDGPTRDSLSGNIKFKGIDFLEVNPAAAIRLP